MKCYQHKTEEAIGICKSCGKGICPVCCIDLNFAIVCSKTCEDAAIISHKITANAVTVYATQKKNRYLLPAYFMVIGIIFLIYGLMNSISFNLCVSIGICVIIFAVLFFIIQMRYSKKINT